MEKPKPAWKCICGKTYKRGNDCKAASSHRNKCEVWQKSNLGRNAVGRGAKEMQFDGKEETEKEEETEEEEDDEEEDDKEEGVNEEEEPETVRRSRRTSSQVKYSGMDVDNEHRSSDSDSDPGAYVGTSLAEAIPEGMILRADPPRLGKKLKNCVFVYRWDTGWFHGTISHFFTSERRSLSRDDQQRGCNFEVIYHNETHYMNTVLSKDTYSCCADAPENSWALCIKKTD